MRRILTVLVRGAVVVGILVSQSGYAALNVVTAQQKTLPIKITRIYTGADGQSHFEDVMLATVQGVPDGQHTDMFNAGGVQFVRTPAGTFRDWHLTGSRAYVSAIQGQWEIEVGGGVKRTFGPGDIILAEDTTGKGHVTRTGKAMDRISIVIPAPAK
jgi:hypothetical protein